MRSFWVSNYTEACATGYACLIKQQKDVAHGKTGDGNKAHNSGYCFPVH